MITRTFKLCLNAGTGSAPFINVSQTDKDEVWLFELYTETGERYIPSSGAIIGIKADGHGIANTGTVDSEGRVVITETEQMTAAAGRSIFELSIDGLTHGTANFIVNVEKKPIDGAIMLDSDLSLISEAIDSAAVIVDVIGDGDPSEVIGEHVDAWLDNHPEATTTVEDGAITAPKINQSLWDKLLVSEEASGAVASFDDGADDVPVSSLKVALEPIQTGSGDPSPSNVRPIIAANGKNLLQNVNSTRTQNGITYTVNADGSVTATGTATNGSYFVFTSANNSINDYTVTIIPSGTSIIASTDSTKVLRVRYTDGAYENLTNGSAKTLTKNIGLVLVEYSSGTTANETIKPMIRRADITDASYQPYQGIMVEQTGKNTALLSDSAKLNSNNCTYVYTADNGITVTATGTYSRIAYTFPVTVGETYTVSLKAYQTGLDFHKIYIDYGTTWDSHYGRFDLTTTNTEYSVTFTASTNILFIGFYATGSSGTSGTMTVTELQLEHGSEATTYEPYTSASYPYTLGQSVYGGTVDLATGVLTVDKWIVDMGTATYGNANALGLSQITSVGAKQFDNSVVADVYSDILVADTANRVYQRAKDNSIGINSAGRIQFVMSSIANYTSAQIQTALTGHYVVYPLATPTTVQLTPQEVKTLLGYNNISSTGTVDVIYHADTKLYVDKMTAVDNAIIAPTEETFTATRNYTVNDLVIVADTLYKVTANIASGSAITPNSNVTATTLGALIKALS